MQAEGRELRGDILHKIIKMRNLTCGFTSKTIIVVGAGVGRTSGWPGSLSRAGLPPVILEARDRIGGRILTVHGSESRFTVELGAVGSSMAAIRLYGR